MAKGSTNKQMFALPGPPPEQIALADAHWKLRRVFKHDFFAATCLYEQTGKRDSLPEKVVVKFSRAQPFMGLDCSWYARFMRAHEEGIYRVLSGVRGVPRWIGHVGPTGYAIEYIDAAPLDHMGKPPAGFFDRLAALFEQIHQRGVAYCDANKRSNILVGPDGEPWLVDYQISFRRRDDWPWPIRPLLAKAVDYVIQRDIYHLCKHKRRLAPEELSKQEEALSRRRTGLHALHRKLTKPWRSLRRGILNKQHREGRLESPTRQLEDHHQPEKATWRDG
ncbi:MAG: hypothetical protein ACLFUJ_08690 [Phycisphaerae bacterium]